MRIFNMTKFKNLLKNFTFYTILGVIVIVIIAVLIYPCVKDNNILIEYIKTISLIIGGSFVLIQIFISNNRVKNEELIGRNNQLNKAIEFLESKNEFSRSGAIYIIYQLYRTDKQQYEKLIVDIFSLILQEGKSQKVKNQVVVLISKHKWYISEKEQNQLAKKFILSKTDFSDMDLSNLNFENANLEECQFNNTVMQGINLKNAIVPYPLNLSAANLDMRNCTFDNIGTIIGKKKMLGSGSNLRGINFTGSSFKNVNFSYATVEGCNFSKCNFQGATIEDEKLLSAKSLYKIKGLNSNRLKKLKEEKPKLFEKENKNENKTK